MNRAELVQAITACDALAAELRKALRADALSEFEEQGTAPTWRLPGHTVSTSITHPTVQVTDEAAFLGYVREVFPTEIEVITTVRSAWRKDFLTQVAERGDPPCDTEGTVIPGLAYYAGGAFYSVTVKPTSGARRELQKIAAEIVGGIRPLALPVSRRYEEDQ